MDPPTAKAALASSYRSRPRQIRPAVRAELGARARQRPARAPQGSLLREGLMPQGVVPFQVPFQKPRPAASTSNTPERTDL
jgi:hypothetical protein